MSADNLVLHVLQRGNEIRGDLRSCPPPQPQAGEEEGLGPGAGGSPHTETMRLLEALRRVSHP